MPRDIASARTPPSHSSNERLRQRRHRRQLLPRAASTSRQHGDGGRTHVHLLCRARGGGLGSRYGEPRTFRASTPARRRRPSRWLPRLHVRRFSADAAARASSTRRDPAAIDLSCRVSQHITLKRPIVSANMDTVTRAPMAIVQAEEGGLGIIDRGFRPGDIQPQVREVEIVKRTQHGVIRDPYSIAPAAVARRGGGADGAVARRHAGRRRRGAPAARAC